MVKDNPERKKELDRRWRYGIEPEQYDQMLKDQNNRCPICDRESVPQPKADIDHDKEEEARSGKIIVRGLLCGLCNRGIGHFKHNPALHKSRSLLCLIDEWLVK